MTGQTCGKDTERHGKNTAKAGQGHDKHMNEIVLRALQPHWSATRKHHVNSTATKLQNQVVTLNEYGTHVAQLARQQYSNARLGPAWALQARSTAGT
jgi:hypothetical protein